MIEGMRTDAQAAVQTNWRLPPRLHARLKKRSILEGVDMTTIVIRALDKELPAETDDKREEVGTAK